METFFTYIQLGFDHIIDIQGYDHILFIISLTILYSLKEWKSLLILVTAFTLGHSTTLAFTVLDIINFRSEKVEFLIMLSISITALLNIIRNGKTPNNVEMKIYYIIAILFGFIHGMGFASYLKAILGSHGNLLSPLLGFNIGLEIGQLIIVSALLLFTFTINLIFNINKQSFIVIISSIIFGITIPILLERDILILFK
jgi:hypothetical protein